MGSYNESKKFLKKSDFTLDEYIYKGLFLGFTKEQLERAYFDKDNIPQDLLYDVQYVQLFNDDENKLITDFLSMLFNMDGHKFENLKLAIEITLRKKKSKMVLENLIPDDAKDRLI